jgi:hypothetical protein
MLGYTKYGESNAHHFEYDVLYEKRTFYAYTLLHV